jgi:hypothetical protein
MSRTYVSDACFSLNSEHYTLYWIVLVSGTKRRTVPWTVPWTISWTVPNKVRRLAVVLYHENASRLWTTTNSPRCAWEATETRVSSLLTTVGSRIGRGELVKFLLSGRMEATRRWHFLLADKELIWRWLSSLTEDLWWFHFSGRWQSVTVTLRTRSNAENVGL